MDIKLNASHPPKEASIEAFKQIEIELKTKLQHLRHEENKHEKEFFYPVRHLSDKQLTNFSSDDLKEVRVGESAYGTHLFGKVLIPDSDPEHSYPEKGSSCYFMFRAFIGPDGAPAKLHSIRMDEIEEADGNKLFKAIFSQNDALEYFEI